MSFFSESRRRKFLRVALLYIVAAWIVLQVADLAFPGLDIPESAIRYVWLGAFLCFPMALLAGWLYDITPKGIVRTTSDDVRDVSGKPLRRKDYLILTALLLMSGTIIFGLTNEIARMRMAAQGYADPEQELTASIAVLPFVNSSDNQQDAYLSNGLSEDILNNLGRLGELHVASRSSSFTMNGADADIGLAAKTLLVDHILTGSIERSGEVVRVTARLVRATQGKELWAETYEREWTEIFGIQEDIASSVARALGVDDSVSLTTAREPDREAYDLYLRARHIAQARTPETLAKSVSLVLESLDIDPLFAEGRGFLATLYFLQKAYAVGTAEEEASVFDLAEHTAVQALVLDENLPGPRAILAVRAMYRYEWRLAEENFKRAVAVAPNDSQVRRWYSRQLMWLGYLEEALLQARAAQRLDPISAVSNGNLGIVFALLDEDAEAKKFAGIARELGLGYFYSSDIMVDLGNGRLADAAKAWTAGLEALGHDTEMVTMVVEASERPEMISSTLEYLDALGQEAEPGRELAQALLLLRQYDAYLSNLEGDWFLMLWCPLARPIRQLPSFQAEVTKAGMFEYWKERGWPDLCHPSDDGFVCN